ncbi:PREDICTED: carbonic anhydrase 6 [Ceratotherium simum simum]|uniref:Carbonic anhydrase n=1 Tax=Ceratotherium simum simum TaxID=73337 RepID=A0ABM1CIE6_CERSS|nr:PREDICTED: carbonic anhydrase 6 [Ceratotherium simum simum]XP_014639327.1 PREDICTED: carbonic anhydrase 6 [Ceratotherium simum simum]
MVALGALLSLLLLGAQAQHRSKWTYSEGALDEAHWSTEYPTCGGQRQSPINLQRKKVQYNPSLTALTLVGYDDQESEFPMTNNGHTVQISLPHTMYMTAPDGTKYIAEQMHFHWGGASSEISGSEHTIDGIRYATEIHVVHYNSKYESYDIAQNEPDGLAVLAALTEVSDYAENTYYSKFMSHLDEIRYAGQSTVLSGLDVKDMLPTNLHYYYSYQGSLTTPPCTENVHWFVLADHVKLSEAQILKLENSLLDHQNKTLNNGYRSTQALNDRVVETNFMYLSNQESVLGSELQSYLSKINNNLEYFRRLIEQKKGKRKSKY